MGAAARLLRPARPRGQGLGRGLRAPPHHGAQARPRRDGRLRRLPRAGALQFPRLPEPDERPEVRGRAERFECPARRARARLVPDDHGRRLLEAGPFAATRSEFAGDFGWPYFGKQIQSADEKKSKLNMELQNGRAAMFGVLGLMMQDAVNGEVTIFPGTDIA